MFRKTSKILIICLLVVTLLVPATASAIDKMDLTKQVNLTVTTDEVAMSGMELSVYKVAETDEWAEFTLTGPFADYNVAVNGLDNEGWKALAETLSAYVERDGITPQVTAVMNDNGNVPFGQLDAGLYLVYGAEYTSGEKIYTPTPFMICLPNRAADSETWDYDVNAGLKYGSREVEKAKIELSVHKTWIDEGLEKRRPEYITVQLLRDGAVYDEVKLSEANNWRHTWNSLEADHQYQVAETEVFGYEVSVSREDDCFVIENIAGSGSSTNDDDFPVTDEDKDEDKDKDKDKNKDKDKEKLPQTGVLWWPVPVLIVFGLLCIIIGLTRRKGTESGNH